MLTAGDIAQVQFGGFEPERPVVIRMSRVQQQMLLQICRCMQGRPSVEQCRRTDRRQLLIEQMQGRRRIVGRFQPLRALARRTSKSWFAARTDRVASSLARRSLSATR